MTPGSAGYGRNPILPHVLPMAPRRWQGLGEIVGMDYDAKPTMLVVPEPPFETHSQNQKKNSFGQFHPICHF